MMAGGSARHATISGNIQGTLRAALCGMGCQVFQSDLRVELAANGFAAYPDQPIAPPGWPATLTFADVYKGVTDFTR